MLVLAKLAAIGALVSLNAFFVAAEFALVKIRDSQLDALVGEGNQRAAFTKQVIKLGTSSGFSSRITVRNG